MGLISRLLKHVKKGGRLILRFDDPLMAKNTERVRLLRAAGYTVSRTQNNKPGKNIAVWIGVR